MDNEDDMFWTAFLGPQTTPSWTEEGTRPFKFLYLFS